MHSPFAMFTVHCIICLVSHTVHFNLLSVKYIYIYIYLYIYVYAKHSVTETFCEYSVQISLLDYHCGNLHNVEIMKSVLIIKPTRCTNFSNLFLE